MHRFCLAMAALGALALTPAEARQPDRPITDNDPGVMDVAKTPTTDLNITREEIPAVLIAAVEKPYDLTGLDKCRPLTAAVEELDAILGPDFDLPQEARDRVSAGRVAKWVVSSFIPFRGLIRELSGANAQERAIQAAIQAGLARRGFLKGVGAVRRCGYPASPATPQAIDAYLVETGKPGKKEPVEKAEARGEEPAQERTSSGVPIVSQPVVQPVP
ncbi:hypothetical protein [Novosphingobium endophyticum]|uniref:hypothetical protein n=1 Tax=Novosphingobium endophyticum TaxID=1955250 RepID=UPI001E51F105|nr:hypothetical protein [Novosphingobium endophyticum]